MAQFTISAVAIGASMALFGCVAPRPAQDAKPQPAIQHPGTIGPEPAPPTAQPKVPPAPVPPAAVTAPAPPPASNASPSVPPGRPLAKPSGTSGTTQPKPATQPPVAATKPAPASPTLDLASLEQRLKDTKAIGVFTKLSLKNQVDDLLGELRAFHSGSAQTPTAVLRQKYDTLMIKVLTLLQDGDPQLASAIASSREALWGILMDPKKFSQI
jgi:hypothetical protein